MSKWHLAFWREWKRHGREWPSLLVLLDWGAVAQRFYMMKNGGD